MRARFKAVAEAHLVLLRGGKTLLLRRYNTGYQDGNYGLIAGHIEKDECARAAMAREAREEAGIEVSVNDLSLFHLVHRREREVRISFFFTTVRWSGEPRNMEPHRCDEMGWYPANRLPPNVVPYVRQSFELGLAGQTYSEHGW